MTLHLSLTNETCAAQEKLKKLLRAKDEQQSMILKRDGDMKSIKAVIQHNLKEIQSNESEEECCQRIR